MFFRLRGRPVRTYSAFAHASAFCSCIPGPESLRRRLARLSALQLGSDIRKTSTFSLGLAPSPIRSCLFNVNLLSPSKSLVAYSILRAFYSFFAVKSIGCRQKSGSKLCIFTNTFAAVCCPQTMRQPTPGGRFASMAPAGHQPGTSRAPAGVNTYFSKGKSPKGSGAAPLSSQKNGDFRRKSPFSIHYM